MKKLQEQITYEKLLDDQRALMLKLRQARLDWLASIQPGTILIIHGSPAIYVGRDGYRLRTVNQDGHPQPITLLRQFGIPAMIPYDPAATAENLAWRAIVAQEIHLDDAVIEESTFRQMAVDPKGIVATEPNRVEAGLIHDRVTKMLQSLGVGVE